MTRLPDYDRLKTVISNYWSANYPANSIKDQDILELLTIEAKEANLSLENFLIQEAAGSWSTWINSVQISRRNPEQFSSKITKIEQDDTIEADIKAVLIEQAKEESEDYEFLLNSDILDLLAVKDLSNFKHLSEAADKLELKSWQLTEYIESLRDELGVLDLHYGLNKGIDENKESTLSISLPITDHDSKIVDNTIIDPSQSSRTIPQPSTKSYLIPGLISLIALLLIILTILVLNLSRKGENQKSKSIEKGLSIGREAPTALPVPEKADSILKPTQSIAPTNNITNKANCRFPENGTNGELRICKVVKRVNANNHIVYDVYPPFDDLNKFAVVLWDNDTAEFFYEGTRYEATTSDLINQFIKITATNADYSFSFIPKPHN